jgi:transaldolase
MHGKVRKPPFEGLEKGESLMNPLRKLSELGQSIWLDFIRRDLMTSGKLEKLVREDGLRGMTSNPKIFDEAISESDHYMEPIRRLAEKGCSTEEAYERLTVQDVQMAADVFRSVYDETKGHDGYVSYEVSPHLAHDTEGTVDEARRLWKTLDRPNIFIKVPATLEGLPAIRRLISEGINVNVTLLFGLPRYRKVADAYLSGLEDRLKKGGSVTNVASVASFFLSRIDVLVDPMLEKIMKEGGSHAPLAKEFRGETAIASAKLAYQIYKQIYGDKRFGKLSDRGARPQRLLWASTSTKNPDYSDVKYVEPLIGPNTVNTVPMNTLDAYRDHGDPEVRLEDEVQKARRAFDVLPKLEIDIDEVTQQLEDEGVEKFNKPYDDLMKTLRKELGKAGTVASGI